MTTERPRILVLGHDAAQQGAPVVLLRLLEWLHKTTRCDFELAFHQGGQLLERLARIGPTRVVNPWLGSPGTIARLTRLLVSQRAQDRYMAGLLRRRVQRGRYRLVWVNSLASWRLVEAVAPRAVPCLLHVHELQYAIARLGVPMDRLPRFADHFVAVSHAVREALVRGYRIPETRSSVIYACVSEDAGEHAERPDSASEIDISGFESGDFLLVSCGVAQPHKGTDLLPRLINEIDRRSPKRKVHALWVGHYDQEARLMVCSDADRLGVSDRVHFVGQVADPQDLFKRSDLFILPSREDSFPLVCLEAGQVGLPTVCFDGAGGAPEFVGNDAGRVVPFLDIGAMAQAVTDLIADPELRNQLGCRAREKANRRFSVAQQGPKLLELMQNLVGIDLV
jgi:glycosyltransferase involved in cell wall biosynthesis